MNSVNLQFTPALLQGQVLKVDKKVLILIHHLLLGVCYSDQACV